MNTRKQVDLQRVALRLATVEDKETIERLVKLNWGENYPLLDELDSWLSDDQVSGSLVALIDGDVIAFMRETKLTPREWWAEGAVVHPDYQGIGIANRLTLYGYQLWKQARAGCIRWMFAASNQAIVRIAERYGARVVATYTHMTASTAESRKQFVILPRDRIPWAFDFLRQSPLLEAARGLVERRWAWRVFTKEFFAFLVERGEVFYEGEDGSVVCAWRRPLQQSIELRVWLARAGGRLEDLARDLRGFRSAEYRSMEISAVHWRVPDEPMFVDALSEAGFERRQGYEHAFHIVELRDASIVTE
jgi:ribosomal protein S18 acetylase RimI-like enzyme